MTVAYAASMAAMWPIGLLWLRRSSDVPALDMARDGLRCLLAYSACGAAAYAGCVLSAGASPYIQIAAALSGMLAMMLGLYLTWPGYRRDVLAILNTRSLLRAAKS